MLKGFTKNRQIFIELITTGVFLLLFLNNSSVDPGGMIFLFVYENLILFFCFTIFATVFYPLHSIYLDGIKPIKFSEIGTLIIGYLAIFVVTYLIVIFLNQLTVEFLVAYLKNSSFHFKSIEILNKGRMYFEKETMTELENHFNTNYSLFFWLYSAKYLILFMLDFFLAKDLKTNRNASVKNAYQVGVQLIVSPIAIFLASIILTVLAAIFGAQIWIVFVSLALFRLLFMWISKKVNTFIQKA